MFTFCFSNQENIPFLGFYMKSLFRASESQNDNAVSSIKTPAFRGQNNLTAVQESEGLLDKPIGRKSAAVILGQECFFKILMSKFNLSQNAEIKRHTVVVQAESDSDNSKQDEPPDKGNGARRRGGFLEKLQDSSKNFGSFKGSPKLFNSRVSLFPNTKKLSNESDTISSFSSNTPQKGIKNIIVSKRVRKRFF